MTMAKTAAVVVGVCLGLAAGHAGAQEAQVENQEPERRSEAPKPLNVGVFIGYGTRTLNTGLGARVGYTAPSRLYLGGMFVYHLGESAESGSGGFVTRTSLTYVLTGPEIGYAAAAGPVELRPYFGFGAALGTSSTTGLTNRSRSEASGVMSPGGLIAIALGEHAYVGFDVRALFFTAGGVPQAAFGGIAGARF